MAEAVPIAEFAGLIPPTALAVLPRGPLRARRLHGGRQVNLCLEVEDSRRRRLVLRVRRGPKLAGADAQRELECQRTAAVAGLAPAILAADASDGWVLMAHVEGEPWSVGQLRDADRLWRLGTQLRRLHALPAPAFEPVDGLALLRAHCDVLDAHGDVEGAALLRRGSELTAQLALLPRRRPVLCHGDPDVENFLGAAPVLIDFEYAQIADPVYDVALLLAYYPELEPQIGALLAATGLDDALSRRRLPLQLQLSRVVNEAWARAQALLGRLD